MQKGRVFWFIGIHGSGKTTISRQLAEFLRKSNAPAIVLDGDELRKIISSDLGYSLEERNEHMRRTADLCKLISDNGISCIACVASPTEKSREYVKNHIEKILTVYVKCPIEVCEKRDVKGHYKKARSREKGFENFLGVSLKFEEPENPDITLNTDKETIEESTKKLIDFIIKKKFP